MNTNIKAFIFEKKELNTFAYHTCIGSFVLWGLGVNWLIHLNLQSIIYIGFHFPYLFIAFLLTCYFIFPLLGAKIFRGSKQPLWSLVGYSLIILAFSAVLASTELGHAGIIKEAIRLCIETTLLATLMALFFPKKFENAYWAHGLCLLSTLWIVGLERLLSGAFYEPAIIITLFCFSLYIAHNWFKASRLEKNLDNAIDSAAAIYMDIIELFLQLIRLLILSKKSKEEKK